MLLMAKKIENDDAALVARTAVRVVLKVFTVVVCLLLHGKTLASLLRWSNSVGIGTPTPGFL